MPAQGKEREGATWAARIGIPAAALVYIVLGYLIIRIASGAFGAGSTSDSASGPGVAQALRQQPGGRVMLALLGAALVLCGLFQAYDAAHHHDRGPTAQRWFERAGAAGMGVAYAAFGVYCFASAFTGGTSGSSNRSPQQARSAQWSADVLRWPVGRLWLALIGVVLVIVAAALVIRGLRRSFLRRLQTERMTRRTRIVTSTLGVLGYIGRAALLALVGFFVISAAVENDPSHGQGVNGSARLLARNQAGASLLWAIGLLVASYGVYLAFEGRYRRV